MVTARYASQTLGDHLMGFLAANGVRVEEFEETSPICIFLNALPPRISRRRITDKTKELKKMTGLKHCACLEIILRSYGYAHSTEAFAQMRGGFITRKD